MTYHIPKGTTETAQDDGFSVRLPTDPEYAGVAFHRPFGHSADVSKLRVVYKCYAQVNVTGIIDEDEDEEDVTGLTVHRCKVPNKSNYRGSGTFAHNFGKDDCTNGKPAGDCDAMFSKAAHDSGENEGYMAFPPVSFAHLFLLFFPFLSKGIANSKSNCSDRDLKSLH